MINPIYQRVAALIGEDNLHKLHSVNVTVVGLGGVGYTAAEILVRSGVEHLLLVDFDTVSESNINRQLLATHSTIGKPKSEVARSRLLDINPDACIEIYNGMLTPDTIDDILNEHTDYVIDAIDTIAHKVFLIQQCLMRNIKFISSLGAGNRLDPSKVTVCDLSKTSGDPFARNIRRKLRTDGVLPPVTVVCSTEVPRKIEQPDGVQDDVAKNHSKSLVGSFAGVTVVFGTMIATKCIMDIIEI